MVETGAYFEKTKHEKNMEKTWFPVFCFSNQAIHQSRGIDEQYQHD
jgi:hypothetical protein